MADLYTSTREVLAFIEDLLLRSTVIVFDNWYIFGDTQDLGEGKAFAEWPIHNRFSGFFDGSEGLCHDVMTGDRTFSRPSTPMPGTLVEHMPPRQARGEVRRIIKALTVRREWLSLGNEKVQDHGGIDQIAIDRKRCAINLAEGTTVVAP